MTNAIRLTLNAPYATVILIVAADTLVPLCAQIPSNGKMPTLQVFDPARPDTSLFDGMIDQFAANLGLVILPNRVQLPKADYQKLQSVAKVFWESRGVCTGTDKAPATVPNKPVDLDKPTWSKRTRSAELLVEQVTKPYTHVRENGRMKGTYSTVLLVPATKGDARVVFDDTTWQFKAGPPVPGTLKTEQGLRSIVRDDWAAKKLNQELNLLKSGKTETIESV